MLFLLSCAHIHLAEERGQVDSGAAEMDEEERYSSVIRNGGAPTAGKYVPPGKRAGQPTQLRESREKDKDGKDQGTLFAL